jgi:hypothetical protein
MKEALAATPGLSVTQRQDIQRHIDEKEAADYTLARRMLAHRTWQDDERAGVLGTELAEIRDAGRLLVNQAGAGSLPYIDAVRIFDDLLRRKVEAVSQVSALVERHRRTQEELQDPVGFMDRMRSKWGEQHYSPV